MKNTLTIIVGLPRCGKSTWIEKNKGDAVVVSNDWIRENILGTHYSSNANALIWSITDATLRIVLGQGKDAILDGINHTADVRRFFIDLARQYKSKVKMVCIMTPVGICLARNSKAETNKLPQDKLIAINNKIEWPDGRGNLYDEVVYVDNCWSELELNK